MIRHVAAVSALCAALLSSLAAADWPQFRGPDGQGHCDETGLPLSWSEEKNVTWKTPLEGLGWSSPAIQGEQIWVTTATEEGQSLRAVCIHRDSGEILHDVEVIRQPPPEPVHQKNSHASPTPIVEGDRVYLHYGAHGTACISTAGEVLWRNHELKYAHQHGPGGSPASFEDVLIICCDGTDVQFVVALEKQSGRIRWKTTRSGNNTPMAYCTPLIIEVDGRPQALCPGGGQMVSYDPRTGAELWKVRYDGYSVVPRPVYGDGRVFFSSSYNNAVLYAARVDGAGDVTDTHVEWSMSRGAPHNPSTLLVGEELYVVSDRGLLTCLDAASGEEIWQEQLGGNYSASPLYADGRIYLTDEDGRTVVIAPGREYEEFADNQVEGRTLASLAVADGAIFLRTDTHLYRIEE